jgi:hypothetical protein
MILNDEVQMLRRVPLFSGIDAGEAEAARLRLGPRLLP